MFFHFLPLFQPKANKLIGLVDGNGENGQVAHGGMVALDVVVDVFGALGLALIL